MNDAKNNLKNILGKNMIIPMILVMLLPGIPVLLNHVEQDPKWHADKKLTTSMEDRRLVNSIKGLSSSVNMNGDKRVNPTGLSDKWCGSIENRDRASAATAGKGNRFKAYYVHPSDQNNLSKYGTLIQGAVKKASENIYAASNRTKTLILDTGSSCGSQYLDIQDVSLSEVENYYSSLNNSSIIVDEVSRAVIKAMPEKNLGFIRPVIYMDVGPYWKYWFAGLGTRASAIENTGVGNNKSQVIVIINTGYTGRYYSLDDQYAAYTLHEIFHTLGSVYTSVPHTTGGGHCTDGIDIMCYYDSGEQAAKYTDKKCPVDGYQIKSIIDCGGDDYFNPNPKPGTFLNNPGTWNTYNSSFLTECINQVSIECISPKYFLKNQGEKSLSIIRQAKRKHNFYIEQDFSLDRNYPSIDANTIDYGSYSLTSANMKRINVYGFEKEHGILKTVLCLKFKFKKDICKSKTVRINGYNKSIKKLSIDHKQSVIKKGNYVRADFSIYYKDDKSKKFIKEFKAKSPKQKLW